MLPPEHLQMACQHVSLGKGVKLPLKSLGLEVPLPLPFKRNTSSQLQLHRASRWTLHIGRGSYAGVHLQVFASY